MTAAVLTRTRLARSPEVVEANFGPDERALLHLGTSRYHVLNPVAARVWELLEAPHDLDALCVVLAAEYAVSPDACRADVQTYLGQLLGEDLVVQAP